MNLTLLIPAIILFFFGIIMLLMVSVKLVFGLLFVAVAFFLCHECDIQYNAAKQREKEQGNG